MRRIVPGVLLSMAVLFPFGACKRPNPSTPPGLERRVAALQPGNSGKAIKVQYKVGDPGAASDAHIKPHIKLVNYGTVSIPLSAIKVRYWYTIEAGATQQFSVDYAQIGSSKITGAFVKLPAPRMGATHYLDVGFTTSAGSLAAGANTGEIQTRFNKTDWSTYYEADDHSFISGQNAYGDAMRITAYRNGDLIWGTEPLPDPACDTGTRLVVDYRAGDSTAPNDSQIKPHVKLINTGFADVPLSEIKIRYWYSREGTVGEQFWVDFAQIGNSKVTGTFVSVPNPVGGANRYLEIGFTSTAGTLLGGANTGEIQVRFNKTDWSNYAEADDKSYIAGQSVYVRSDKITIYRNGFLLSGVEPASGAPIAGQSINLVASKSYTPVSFVDGVQTFSSVTPFTIPLLLPVSEGNAGNQTLTLTVTTPSGTITCTYQGGATLQHPTTREEILKGLAYYWTSCSSCVAPSSTLFPTQVRVHINNGDSAAGRTVVDLHVPSPNEPPPIVETLPPDAPFWRTAGDDVPLDGDLTSDVLPPEPSPFPEYDPDVEFTSNPIEAGHVDTVDPNIIVDQ